MTLLTSSALWYGVVSNSACVSLFRLMVLRYYFFFIYA